MKNIRHTGIVVADLEQSLSFYRDTLGLKMQKDKREKGSYIDIVLGLRNADVRTVKLSADDGNLVELLYYYSPCVKKEKVKGINATGYSHLAFSVNNVDQEYKKLKKQGIDFISSPQRSSDGYAKIVFCRDPDGNFIELVEILNKCEKRCAII